MGINAIRVEFTRGYCPEDKVGRLPDDSGIYCVYVGTRTGPRSVKIRRLIYVGMSGEAGGIRDRVAGHEKWSAWRRYARAGEGLWFSAALVPSAAMRATAEAAIINHARPPANDTFKDAFPFPTTRVLLSGKAACLAPKFTVASTLQPAEKSLSGKIVFIRITPS